MAHVLDSRRGERKAWALAVLCLPVLIVSLDSTVLNVALPTLVRKLHASTRDLQWIVDSYGLVFIGLLLIGGSVADRVGRRRTFIAGLVMFTIGSIWAASAGSVDLLIAARASMGVGAAFVLPSTLAILTDTFPDRHERHLAFGIWSGSNGAGIALGPVVGGALLAHFWWGSVFLINVPITVIGLACAVPLLRESKNRAAAPPDPIGALLWIAGIGFLLWAIIQIPARHLSSTAVLHAGIVGSLLLVVFGLFTAWEHRIPHPMLNLSFFAHRRFSAGIIAVGLAMFGLFGALFVLTQFLQSYLGYTALQAGVRTLPAAATIILVAPASSLLVRRYGTKLTVGAGLMAIAGGLWQVSQASITTGYSGALLGIVLLGVGAALVIPSVVACVVGSLPTENVGVGSATNSTFMQVGGAIGVAVMGSVQSTVYQKTLTAKLAPYHVTGHIQQTATASLGSALAIAHHVGGTTGAALVRGARAAFISGMDSSLLVGSIVAFAAVLFVVFVLPSTERSRDQRTHHDSEEPHEISVSPRLGAAEDGA
jgi:EmrB/QacA subfamily drug resistance transporter